ncbi:MAG TPA: TPM domain-containing protein [Bacteroidia bacterium]|nr:TPM domain-containing protein [Bacteroidia bacterium]HQW22110.1 TPM domain-containing protein [Bacteroidia bacterium]
MNTITKFISPLFHRIFFAVCLVLFSVNVNAADDFPERATRLVTDYTGTLRPDELQSLENKLVAFDDTTSMQIAVVMMASVGNYDISDYAVQLFNKWKIGDKKNNSGVLLLVAKDDRKVWITTGYGMEGVFPDALVKQVIDREIVPKFRSGDYFGGIDAGTTAITGITTGEYKAVGKKSKGNKGGVFPFLMFAFIIIVIIISQVGRAKRYGRKNNLGFWAAWALLNAASNRSHGSWGGFTGGGGFGGGGGGGGFGGFGGGMSGGGGAGGSW